MRTKLDCFYQLKVIRASLRLLSRDGYLILIRDNCFLKNKTHEVLALSSAWKFFDKVPLNEIFKTAVWNQSSTFAKFYLRGMSQQASNLHTLGPITVAQKVVGSQETLVDYA